MISQQSRSQFAFQASIGFELISPSRGSLFQFAFEPRGFDLVLPSRGSLRQSDAIALFRHEGLHHAFQNFQLGTSCCQEVTDFIMIMRVVCDRKVAVLALLL
jgi:hypothetical protein